MLSIIKDDLTGNEIASFLQSHMNDMRHTSPPESKHALDIAGLQQADIQFWSGYQNAQLLACGALKTLSIMQGEIKSMRVSKGARGTGIGSVMLNFIIQQATSLGMQELKLETGSMDFFIPARKLYAKHGFVECLPFADYTPDIYSVFMSKAL